MKNKSDIELAIEYVARTYLSLLKSLDMALVGQEEVKKVVASSMLCDANSRILLTGDTGSGKTTLSKFLSSSFNSERISVTSDMIPSDIYEHLTNCNDLEFLQVDEFNRASGKLQSAFIELFAEKQISTGGVKHQFKDFYVFATQNDADIAGIFNVPQAIYDRFDVNIYYRDLTEKEKRQLLFTGFEPAIQSNISKSDLINAQKVINSFPFDEQDEHILMQIFNLVDNMSANRSRLFGGTNIRAHKFALKLAKLAALTNGRNYILATDLVDFINYIYMHRINQNVARIGSDVVLDQFESVKSEIALIKRRK